MSSANKPTSSSKLTPKQERFCREYVIDLNGTQAAIRAGYASKNANVNSSRMLANDNIKAFIAGLAKEQNDSLELKAEDTLREISGIAFTMPSSFEKMQMSTRDKLKALEMLAKHQKLFTDADANGSTAVVVNVIKTSPGGPHGADS